MQFPGDCHSTGLLITIFFPVFCSVLVWLLLGGRDGVPCQLLGLQHSYGPGTDEPLCLFLREVARRLCGDEHVRSASTSNCWKEASGEGVGNRSIGVMV